jgi:methylated-DNA-protein-cysteine methyltransferase related protein
MARGRVMGRLRPRVRAFVAAIPEGRVTTYGAIARCLRATPRQVAFILSHFTPEESATLPWFRVVAANGVISTLKLGAVGRRQIAHLRAEGVELTARHTIIDFEAVFWQPG